MKKIVGVVSFALLLLGCSTLRVSPPAISYEEGSPLPELLEPKLKLPMIISPAPLTLEGEQEEILLPTFPKTSLALGSENKETKEQQRPPARRAVSPPRSSQETVNPVPAPSKIPASSLLSTAKPEVPPLEAVPEIIPAGGSPRPSFTGDLVNPTHEKTPGSLGRYASTLPKEELKPQDLSEVVPSQSPLPQEVARSFPQERNQGSASYPPAQSIPRPDPFESPYLSQVPQELSDSRPNDLVVTPGEEIFIQLPGRGWTDISPGSREAFRIRPGVSQGDYTSFIVEPREEGEYLLSFNGQDPSNGSMRNRQFNLLIQGEGTSARSGNLFSTPDLGALEEARKKIAQGQWKDAQDILVARSGDSHSESTYLLGLTYEKTGEYDQAESLWKRALTYQEGDPFVEKARRSLFELYANRSKEGELNRLVQSWPPFSQSPGEEFFLNALEEIHPRLDPADQRGWINKYSQWYNNPSREDKYLYLYARILERPGPGRDLRLALSLYERILNNHPLSPYYDPARDRLNFVRQNFIYYR